MSVVGAHVVDWTDARKLVVPDARSVSWDEMGRKEVKALNADIHLDLAVDILEKIVSTSCPSNYPFPSLILPRRRFPAPYLLEKLS